MLGKLLFTEQFSFARGDSVVVLGLGRFGGALAQSLVELGHDVMGIDSDGALVQHWADRLTHAVQANATDVSVLRQLGVADFAHGIVGIGTDLAASLMSVVALTELNIKDIWVKAMTPEHGRIAERIGAHHVVYPEADMGLRVAHLISRRLMDYIEFEDGFAIAKILAPAMCQDQSLAASGVRERFGVTVVGVKRSRQDFQHATPDTVVRPGDLLIVSGPTKRVEQFAAQALKAK
ncbi:potassium channel family protein [Ramlibacter rhizophilus]|uniref:TrkA family potassium uptake protein n=1 Tax=Ramlibacter rhizophilus TaxID=1781167 RepID=A0A4Z0BKU0_9BURK|nr:TrkA family potassium uptake protein [Ramlibacter rhizophilus]TFY99942.1 TrkA family potassium uptake protein [Ramlibacter rhizophilus]